MKSEMQENRMNDHDDLSIHERPTAKLPPLPLSDKPAEQAQGDVRQPSTLPSQIGKSGK